jgi:hypothetical protein
MRRTRRKERERRKEGRGCEPFLSSSKHSRNTISFAYRTQREPRSDNRRPREEEKNENEKKEKKKEGRGS